MKLRTLDKYYKDKKFKPGDRVVYKYNDGGYSEIHKVLSFEECSADKEFSEIMLEIIREEDCPIFIGAEVDDGWGPGWMSESELFLVTDTFELMYLKEDHVGRKERS